MSSLALHGHDLGRRLLQRMRIGTIRRSAWSAHGGALSATARSTGIAVSPSATPCHFQAPVHFPRDRVIEHSRNEHRPAGGRRDELERHHERTCRPGRQPRASGCGSGGHAVGARTRSASRRPPGPSGSGEQALLWRMQSPRRKSPRSAAGADGGLLPHCGAAYSFTPKLWLGDLVGGQYLVAGCLAHGGLGWIYLAQDKNVEDTWVVLKGLLDSGDASAMAAAAAEKRFLAEVNHANIVGIKNFVQHDGAGYIVMGYVGGESLRDLRVRHRGRNRRLAAGGSIDSVHLGHPACARLSASPRSHLLRLQARQCHSDGRAAHPYRFGWSPPTERSRWGSVRDRSDTRRRKSPNAG